MPCRQFNFRDFPTAHIDLDSGIGAEPNHRNACKKALNPNVNIHG
jgi:hypothetical protein